MRSPKLNGAIVNGILHPFAGARVPHVPLNLALTPVKLSYLAKYYFKTK